MKPHPKFWISHSTFQCICLFSDDSHAFHTLTLPLPNPELKLIRQEKNTLFGLFEKYKNSCIPTTLLLFYLIQKFWGFGSHSQSLNFICLTLPLHTYVQLSLNAPLLPLLTPFYAVVHAVLCIEGYLLIILGKFLCLQYS